MIGRSIVQEAGSVKDPAATSEGGEAMLVLSRRLGEEIVIDGHIRITVVEIQGNRVRLGISAPPSVSVDRKEIHDRRLLEWSTEPCETD
jgi:carbon storage regulator